VLDRVSKTIMSSASAATNPHLLQIFSYRTPRPFWTPRPARCPSLCPSHCPVTVAGSFRRFFVRSFVLHLVLPVVLPVVLPIAHCVFLSVLVISYSPTPRPSPRPSYVLVVDDMSYTLSFTLSNPNDSNSVSSLRSPMAEPLRHDNSPV